MLDEIDRVRRFTRFYTRKLGLFSSNYNGTGQSVTDARVLYDIGTGAAGTAREISAGLELDEGYVSRIVNRYEKNGWLTRTACAQDARQKRLALTEAGVAAMDRLQEMTRTETLRRLDGVDLARVADALDRAEASFGEIDPDSVELRDLAPGDIGWVIQRNAEFYSEACGFTTEFELLVSDILTDFLRNRAEGRDRAFIAHRDAHRLGSIFCVASEDPAVALLRVLFVEPEARGIGIGRRLIEASLGFARGAGYRRMALTTHLSQTAARAIYAAQGFCKTSEEPGWRFGVAVVQETWELEL